MILPAIMSIHPYRLLTVSSGSTDASPTPIREPTIARAAEIPIRRKSNFLFLLCTYSEEVLPFEYDSTCEVSNYYVEVEESAIGSVFEVSNFIPKVYVSDYYARLEEENEDC